MSKAKIEIGPKVFNEITGSELKSFDEEAWPKNISKIALAPAVGAASTLSHLVKQQWGENDATELLRELNRQINEVSQDDDMYRAQKLLAAQAMTLDSLFHRMLFKAMNSDMLNHYEAFMKIALKAQSQSRCTLETISKIKNPPNATFVKQANITQGNQQVNNYGTQQAAQSLETTPPRAQETANMPNELLEAQHGERLELGPQTAASQIDSKVETVDKGDRPKNRRREKAV